jgi:hypothetical protein
MTGAFIPLPTFRARSTLYQRRGHAQGGAQLEGAGDTVGLVSFILSLIPDVKGRVLVADTEGC